jgi:hypothetical protein
MKTVGFTTRTCTVMRFLGLNTSIFSSRSTASGLADGYSLVNGTRGWNGNPLMYDRALSDEMKTRSSSAGEPSTCIEEIDR